MYNIHTLGYNMITISLAMRAFHIAIVQAHILAIVSILYEKHKVGDLFLKKNVTKKP